MFSKIVIVVQQQSHSQQQEKPRNYGGAERVLRVSKTKGEIACTDWLKYQGQ